MVASILAYASYVPAHRLGPDSGVRGNRAVASFDEKDVIDEFADLIMTAGKDFMPAAA